MSVLSPRASIIVPVFNGARTLPDCLNALRKNQTDDIEILVVDDGSTDESADIARRAGVRVFSNSHRSGPAGARNAGVEHAAAPTVLFVDADVLVPPDTVQKTLKILEADPELAALFGSYDDDPAESNFLSQYKNLLHHFVHQNAKENAATFWAGYGAVRKNVFQEVGGFDELQYPNASIEDIELGVRLSQKNYRILLHKELQVKHLKCWRPWNLLKADVLHRAYPWSKLILGSRSLPNDLNLESSQRISAALTMILIVAVTALVLLYSSFAGMTKLIFAGGAVASLTGVLLLNRRLYAFLARRRGMRFLLAALPWHLAYYAYSTITFMFCLLLHPFRPAKPAGNITKKPGIATS